MLLYWGKLKKMTGFMKENGKKPLLLASKVRLEINAERTK
jgi:hypothetical protein